MIDLGGMNATLLYSNESSQVPKGGKKSKLLAQPFPQEPAGSVCVVLKFPGSLSGSPGPLLISREPIVCLQGR